MTIYEVIGLNVRRFREQREITQESLAYELSMSCSYLSSIESGKANPTIRKLEGIAGRLQVPVYALIRPPVIVGESPHRAVDMGYLYRPTSTFLEDPELGRYPSFGLKLDVLHNKTWTGVDELGDITTDRQVIYSMAKLFTNCQVDPLHFRDVVYDLLP